MKISFFEEFPSFKNLRKLVLINFPTSLYLASSSREKWEYWKKIALGFKKDLEIIWWPLLKIEEGYWFSPFSSLKGMMRIASQIREEKIFLDLELPLLSPLRLMDFSHFWTSKSFLTRFIEEKGEKLILGEIPLFPEKIRTLLGLSFPGKSQKICYLLYSTLLPFWVIKREMEKGIKKFGENFIVGVGCLGKGITHLEREITFRELDRVLKLAKSIGVREVIIYRLGGIGKETVKLLEKFL